MPSNAKCLLCSTEGDGILFDLAVQKVEAFLAEQPQSFVNNVEFDELFKKSPTLSMPRQTWWF